MGLGMLFKHVRDRKEGRIDRDLIRVSADVQNILFKSEVTGFDIFMPVFKTSRVGEHGLRRKPELNLKTKMGPGINRRKNV